MKAVWLRCSLGIRLYRSAPWSTPPLSVSQMLQEALNRCLYFLIFILAVFSLPSIHRDPIILLMLQNSPFSYCKRRSPYGDLEAPFLTHYLSDPFGVLIFGLLLLSSLPGVLFPQSPHGSLQFIYGLVDFSQSIYNLYLEICRFVLDIVL